MNKVTLPLEHADLIILAGARLGFVQKVEPLWLVTFSNKNITQLRVTWLDLIRFFYFNGKVQAFFSQLLLRNKVSKKNNNKQTNNILKGDSHCCQVGCKLVIDDSQKLCSRQLMYLKSSIKWNNYTQSTSSTVCLSFLLKFTNTWGFYSATGCMLNKRFVPPIERTVWQLTLMSHRTSQSKQPSPWV